MPSKVPAYGRGARALFCRECGRSRAEVASMSARGLCVDCSTRRDADCQTQMRTGTGPHYEQWIESVRDWADSLSPHSA